MRCGAYAPVVPQDAHFVLTFAHPVVDAAEFDTRPPAAGNPVGDPTSSFVGKDDMSNINPQPPAVQFQYRHSLLQVAIFEYKGGAWQFLCAMPQLNDERKNAPLGTTFWAEHGRRPRTPISGKRRSRFSPTGCSRARRDLRHGVETAA